MHSRGGGAEEKRKIMWLDWGTVCLSKENGELGVRKLREFNEALLRKWCWQMLVERGGLWYRVLTCWFGERRGQLNTWETRGSAWWQSMNRTRQGVRLSDTGWWLNNVERVVGNGENSLFWRNPWLEGGLLIDRFQRLYDLSEYKEASVVKMFELGWGVGGDAWSLRKRSFAWEKELVGECIRLLESVMLQEAVDDSWG
ncbi:unnamed protein product [Vicia faba]|uniref:Uncharacterized protein n=1 Tax=Vicia faba TaxID=3906 RepID=A0AAV0Z8P8_VICFA|nr:unnamed protein product [Vicia faba]